MPGNDGRRLIPSRVRLWSSSEMNSFMQCGAVSLHATRVISAYGDLEYANKHCAVAYLPPKKEIGGDEVKNRCFTRREQT